MGKILTLNDFKPEALAHDFETKGWTRISPPQDVKENYFKFLENAHKFFDGDQTENQKLVNPHGLVFPGFLTYPGGRDGYFQDTTHMYHVSLFEEEKAGPEGIESFTRYACVWPKDNEAFKQTFIQMRDHLYGVAHKVLEAVELYYNLPKGDLTQMIEDGWSMQRAMIYQPFQDPARVGTLTVGEHRDTSLLTITYGGSQPGLELKDELGNWVPVCGKQADLIIGVGGMLEQITNGNFKNMFHRVKYVEETMTQSRVSSPFFCWPKPESILTPHPQIMKKHNQRSRFPTQLTLEHLEQNLMVPFAYPQEREKIQTFFEKKKKAS